MTNLQLCTHTYIQADEHCEELNCTKQYMQSLHSILICRERERGKTFFFLIVIILLFYNIFCLFPCLYLSLFSLFSCTLVNNMNMYIRRLTIFQCICTTLIHGIDGQTANFDQFQFPVTANIHNWDVTLQWIYFCFVFLGSFMFFYMYSMCYFRFCVDGGPLFCCIFPSFSMQSIFWHSKCSADAFFKPKKLHSKSHGSVCVD